MKNDLILLPSVTYAMKAKSILEKYQIRAYIQRTPRNTPIKSCGYCLFVPERTDEAEKIPLFHLQIQMVNTSCFPVILGQFLRRDRIACQSGFLPPVL